ncbi:alternative NADP(H) dehydrogenase [Phycomyces blakesleeanus]
MKSPAECQRTRLQQILSTPNLLASFEIYLQRMEAHENLLFIEALSQLRHEQHLSNVESIVHRIWRTFIALGSPLELDIKDAKAIGSAIEAMRWAILTKEKALDIFSEAERDVRESLEKMVIDFDKIHIHPVTSSLATRSQKKVAIIGGGFTGFTVASILDPMPRFHVTLIDTKDSFEYSPGMIKMLVRPEDTSSLRVRHNAYVKNGRVVIGCAERIEQDATAVRVNDELIHFDYLVIATGSTYRSKLKSFDISALYRMSELVNEHNDLKKANSVLIIGGGLVGCELASEISLHDFPPPYRRKKRVTLVESHDDLVRRSSSKRRERAFDYLTRLGVEVICGEKIVDFDTGEQNTYLGSSGHVYRNYDKVYLATGTIPSSGLLQGAGDVGFESCVDLWDRIRVKPTLQLDHWKYQHIFAGGDVTNVDEEKTGFAATLAGVCIARNICRIEKGKAPLRQGAKGTAPAPLKPLHGIGANGGIGRQQMGSIKRTFAFLNPTWAALKSFDEQQFLRIVQGEAAASSLAIGKKPKKLDLTSHQRHRTDSPHGSLSQSSSHVTVANLSGIDVLSTRGSDDSDSLRTYLCANNLFDLDMTFEDFSESTVNSVYGDDTSYISEANKSKAVDCFAMANVAAAATAAATAAISRSGKSSAKSSTKSTRSSISGSSLLEKKLQYIC